MYFSDFESDSDSPAKQNPQRNLQNTHFDNPIMVIPSPNVKKSIEKVPEVLIGASTGKFKSFKEEKVEEFPVQNIILLKEEKENSCEKKAKKGKKGKKIEKKEKNEKIEKKGKKEKKLVENQMLFKARLHEKQGFIEVLQEGIFKMNVLEDADLEKLENDRDLFFSALSTRLQAEFYPPTVVRLKQRPVESQPDPPQSLENVLKAYPDLKLLNTPSFSEKEIYDNFDTFGKNLNTPEKKIIEGLFPKVQAIEEESPYEMIVIENDTEKSRNQKLKKFEDFKSKRIEELEKKKKKNHVKKISSPELPSKFSQIKIVSPSQSPKPSPKPSPRPSTQIEMRSSPRPLHKTREELKSNEEKYRRHKNLPNLVYNKPSNRKIIKNAITQLCMAGEINKPNREEVLRILENTHEYHYFIIVFSETGRRDCRGLYTHDPNIGEVSKVYGPGYLPEVLDHTFVNVFFRYDSGAKEFKVLQCKDFIAATDAVSLKKSHKVYENS